MWIDYVVFMWYSIDIIKNNERLIMTVQITKDAKYIGGGIENMIEGMIEDYNDFISTERMQDKFANGFEIRKGKKYIKVINDNSCKMFYCKHYRR